MKFRIAAGAFALASALGIASCSTDTPTAPSSASDATLKSPQSGQLDKQGPKSRGQSLSFPVAGPLSETVGGPTVANFAGTFSVTKFAVDETSRELMVSGILNGTVTYVDNTIAPKTVTNLAVTFPATLAKGGDVASANSIYHMATAATCGILLLNLGPLHLDLLGLVIDLNQVILDITAQTGAGNLLGNLLCALVGIFDIPGALAGIIQLLDSINNLLSGIGGLAAPAGMDFHGTAAFLRSA